MDLETFGVISLVAVILIVLVIEILAIVLVAGAIASWLGVSGLLWWAFAIVLFLVINGVVLRLVRD